MFKSIGMCLLSLLLFGKAHTQTNALTDAALLEKLNSYTKANPSNLLFVHTDKTIYTNNETVWFSAYLLKSRPGYLKEHSILSVAMVKEDSRKVYLQDKYAVQDGLSFGSLNLPDSIPPGNYQFVASTNVLDKNGRPLAIFTQPLSIKSITQQNFNATLSLLDTVVNNGAIRAKVTIEVKEPKSKEKASVEYGVGKEAKQRAVLSQNNYIITVPSEQLNQSQPVLLTSVKYDKEVQYLSLKLPGIKYQGINVRFFPEGGNFSNGLESTIGWEAKTTGNLPVALSGILYKNDLAIDTIATNSYGIGTFRLNPDSKSSYALKVAANSYMKQDTIYKLPKALENGIAMHLEDAVVNDTLRISLFSKQARNVKVLVHNYREAYASVPVQVTQSGSRLRVALPALPKGMATITVLDAEGKPLAERLFFAHYDHRITASIQVDKEFGKRDSVQVKLKLTNQTGKPVQGIASISAIQDNRMESSKQQDIESYVYLSHELGSLQQDPQGRGFSNKEYLENILLVKGWRRYTWQDLMSRSEKDTIQTVKSPVITARVKYNNKLLKKPVMVSVARDFLFDLLTTEADGSFVLGSDKLLIAEGQKVMLSVNQKNKEGYTIEVDDPFIQVNQELAEQVEIQNTGLAQRVQSSSDQELKGMERMIALNEVVISGNKGDNSLYGMKAAGSNACGDYVDEWGYLNYPYSAGRSNNFQPVEGKEYQIRTDIKGDGPGQSHTFKVRSVIYQGCLTEKNNTVFKINGIYTTREFYGMNEEDILLSEPQYLSTLFWKPGIIANYKGEAECSFSTGDITGKFRVVVQGIGVNDVIFGEQVFLVK